MSDFVLAVDDFGIKLDGKGYQIGKINNKNELDDVGYYSDFEFCLKTLSERILIKKFTVAKQQHLNSLENLTAIVKKHHEEMKIIAEKIKL